MPFADLCLQDRENCPAEWPTLRFKQGAIGTQCFHLRDSEGLPATLDITKHTVKLLARTHFGASQVLFAVDAAINDAATAEVCAVVAAADVNLPGLYLGEAVVYEAPAAGDAASSDSSTEELELFPVDRFSCYVEVEQSLAANTAGSAAVVPIAEIRLLMRDKCAEDNFLLDNIEFSDTEIALALRRPVDYWNEQPPPIGEFTPSNFPYRYNWANGAIGELLRIASLNYERNRLRYSAGGLTVDDKDKSAAYLQAAQQYLAEYRAWVHHKKIQINMENGFGSTSIASFGSGQWRL